jgi:O-antigen/teichoic acid export membrane protein
VRSLTQELTGRALRFVRSNVAVYLLGLLISRLGALALIPLYTRRLTPAEYGEYSLAVAGLALLPMCASFGLTAGMSRVYFGTEDRAEGLRALGAVARGMFVVCSLFVVLLGVGIYAFAPPDFFGVTRNHWLLVVAAGAGSAFFTVPDLYFRASQQPKLSVTAQLTAFFLTCGLGLLFVLGLHRGLTGAIEAVAVAWVLMGAFGVFYTLTRLPSARVPAETWKALKFSIPLLPHFIASWLQVTADRWILSAFGASASLGAYYLAIQLLSPVAMVGSAFNDAEAPRFGELYREAGADGAFRALPKQYRSYVLVTLAPAAMIAAGSPLLPIFVGPKFSGVMGVLPLLGLAYVIDALYFPAANYVFYVGRTSLMPIVTVTSAVLGSGLAILLLPRLGILGLLVSRVAASIIRSGAIGSAAFVARPRSAG